MSAKHDIRVQFSASSLMEEIRKHSELLISDICRKRNISAAPVLDKLYSLSDDELMEYLQDSWLKLN